MALVLILVSNSTTVNDERLAEELILQIQFFILSFAQSDVCAIILQGDEL
jgi:hypothetical protein